MDRVEGKSTDVLGDKIARLAEIFPECMTEMRGADGKLKRGIKFNVLKDILSNSISDEHEAYDFTWVGKNAARAEAYRRIDKTLRPCVEDSVDWDTTKNLYIEGDNLDVLKLLQQSYMRKVKMIYIDPPYNTGHDYIFRDSFEMPLDDHAEGIGLFDDDGNKNFVENTESNPRFHSDWCSMIYKRLLLARNLLTDDGVIFISIDDNEQANLKKICDDVFGSENFIDHFAWIVNITGRQISGRGAAKTWESVLVYAKQIMNIDKFIVNISLAKTKMPDVYKGFGKEVRRDEFGDFVVGDTLYNHNRKFNEETRRNLVFSIFYNPNTEEITVGEIGEVKQNFIEILPHRNGDGVHKYHAWRWSKQKIINESHNLLVLKITNGYEVYTKIRDFNITLLKDVITNISNGDGELQRIFDGKRYFDYPKSVNLLKVLIGALGKSGGIVMDFFSGSGTTAHAVMALNAEDGGNRRFIMVQLREECDPKSEAAKAGYKNICEIGKERIRRAGKLIKSDAPLTTEHLDTGFRVLKLDDTNFRDVYHTVDEITQDALDSFEENIKSDRTALDLLFGCLLDWGVELDMPYTSEELDGATIHDYADGALIACFDKNISREVIEYMAKKKPLRAVFRDNGFVSDAAKINAIELFKLYSPDTKFKVI